MGAPYVMMAGDCSCVVEDNYSMCLRMTFVGCYPCFEGFVDIKDMVCFDYDWLVLASHLWHPG